MPQEDKASANTAEKAGSDTGSRRSAEATAVTAAATTRPDFRRLFEEASSGSSVAQTYVCAVCEEPARGFHFGAFTCEGCKSFFGRTCLRKNHERFECKNGGRCDVVGSNRTSCKACRYRRCVSVGMSPLNSRFGRRSKYFKVSMSTSQQPKPPFPLQPCQVTPPPMLPMPPFFYPFFLTQLLHLYPLHHRNLL